MSGRAARDSWTKRLAVAILTNLKDSVEAKVESYEASAGMAACLLVAGVFALGAGAIYLAAEIGAVQACLSFAGGFLFLALCFKIFGARKDVEAHEDLQQVQETVEAAATPIRALSGAAGAVLLVIGAIRYFSRRGAPSHEWIDAHPHG